MKNDSTSARPVRRVWRARLAHALHRLYRATLAPLFGNVCRFTPSCSEYARDAVIEHGIARGGLLAARRVLRCNPWCRGGDDPVPPSAVSPL